MFNGRVCLQIRIQMRFKLLLANSDKINWDTLSGNSHPDAVKLLLDNADKINWFHLSKNCNPVAVNLLLEHASGNLAESDKISKWMFSKNPNPDVIRYLLANKHLIDWYAFSQNSGAAEYLLKHPDKIQWLYFNRNPHPDVVQELIYNNPTKINIYRLSTNSNPIAVKYVKQAENSDNIELIKQMQYLNSHPDVVSQWKSLQEHPYEVYENPGIFLKNDEYREIVYMIINHV